MGLDKSLGAFVKSHTPYRREASVKSTRIQADDLCFAFSPSTPKSHTGAPTSGVGVDGVLQGAGLSYSGRHW